ncbi:MAG: hypothetical protein ACOYIB_02155 [Desulfosporosinus sp.]
MIVLAFLNRTTLTPLLLTYDNESMYLHIDPQGCALFSEDITEPFYRIQEPLLLAHGVMTDTNTVHLVVLKTNGELYYTLICGASTPQTTLIAKLDVRALKYQRLFLFPQGNIIHIFYAYSHQAIKDLWHIEHRYWDGSSWHSAHLGEVVHPREPLYHVNLDSQGNLHLLTVTFQGRHSLLLTNRFNGTFHIWGSPTEALQISGEVVDIAALMTSDNVHHLFWVVRTPNGQFEIRSAQQPDAHELASTWHPSPTPIKSFNPPWKSIGALEINRVLWLLAQTGEEILMQNDGNGWKLISSQTSFRHPLKWVHKGTINFHQTYWLVDQVERYTPVFSREMGFTIKKKTAPVPTPFHTTDAIPPVPAFYPDLISPVLSPSTSFTANKSNEISSPPSLIKENEFQKAHDAPDTSDAPNAPDTPDTPDTPDIPDTSDVPDTTKNPSQDILQSLPVKESVEIEQLITSVAHLEQENTKLNNVIQTMLTKFDQILEAITDNINQPKQSKKSKQQSSHLEESEHPQTELEASLEEPNPVKEAVSNLEKETKNLAQVLQTMLVKQEQSESSLKNLGIQISQLQEEKKEIKNKGGFWNKWIT